MTQTEKSLLRTCLRSYGESFREARIKANLTQLELAHKAGISQAIISHIECGFFMPSSEIESLLFDIMAAE